MQIVIVVVCLALAGVVLAYTMGVFGGKSPTAQKGQPGDTGPRIRAVESE